MTEGIGSQNLPGGSRRMAMSPTADANAKFEQQLGAAHHKDYLSNQKQQGHHLLKYDKYGNPQNKAPYY